MNEAGVHKSAVLLRALGEDASEEVLHYLDPAQAGRIRAALAALSAVDLSETQRVLDEYDACHAKASDSPAVSVQRAPAAHANDVEVAEMSATGRFAGWSAVAAAQALANEPPQAIAAILQRLQRSNAHDIIGHLPGALRDDVVARLDTLANSQPDALDEIEAALAEILSQRQSADLQNPQSMRGQSAEQGALQSFADVATLGPTNLRKLLRILPDGLLVIALKGSEADVLDRFSTAMDERAAQALYDALAAQAPARLGDIESAQGQIVRFANQMLADAEMFPS